MLTWSKFKINIHSFIQLSSLLGKTLKLSTTGPNFECSVFRSILLNSISFELQELENEKLREENGHLFDLVEEAKQFFDLVQVTFYIQQPSEYRKPENPVYLNTGQMLCLVVLHWKKLLRTWNIFECPTLNPCYS